MGRASHRDVGPRINGAVPFGESDSPSPSHASGTGVSVGIPAGSRRPRRTPYAPLKAGGKGAGIPSGSDPWRVQRGTHRLDASEWRVSPGRHCVALRLSA